jgi:glycosyltransferase involved in cell wall biosynthesis
MKIIKPKITIVTVTFNAEDFLEDTIQSIIGQNYPNIEYIIIDGGSTDGTLDIIKKYEGHISYWVSEPDNGIYDAMNKGIKVASGQWINFLNAGDSFVNQSVISHVFNKLKTKAKVICGGINIINMNQQIVGIEKALPYKCIWNRMPCNHQAMFVKSKYLKKNGFNTHYKYASDVDFFMGLQLNKKYFQKLDKVIVNFLEGGYWQQNFTQSHIEILDIISRKIPDIKEIYQHSSFEQLVMGNNPENTFNNNLFFSKTFNKLIKQINLISKSHNKIVLYGYGNIAQFLHTYLDKRITHIVDINYQAIQDEKVFHPESINHVSFDLIIITVLGREKEVTNYLKQDLNISKDKIFSFKLSTNKLLN